MISLSALYLLSFFKGPNFNASVVFASLNGLSVGGLLYWKGKSPPLPFSQSVLIGRAIPYIALAVTGIYITAKTVQVVFGANLIPIPDLGTAVAQVGFPYLATTITGLSSFQDVIMWNTLVATAEESFKVVLINFGAAYLCARGIWSKQTVGGTTEAVWAMGLLVVGFWTFLHTYNAFTSSSSVIMAFLSGLILLDLIVIFHNLIPAIIAHAFWNIFVSASPYCLVGVMNCTQPLLFFSLNAFGIPVNFDAVTISLIAITILFFVLARKRFWSPSDFSSS